MRVQTGKSLHNALQQQRGVALIMAILIVALATILAVNVATEGYMDQRRTGTILGLDQAFQVAHGGEALASEVLMDDVKSTGGAQVDSLNEVWNTPIDFPVEDGLGEIKGQLEDLQGRFNLNNLINPDGTENLEALHHLQRLLERLQMDTKWANVIADWIDSDSNAQDNGAEDTVYASQTPPYLTANMPITRTSELLSLVGFGLDNYRKLEPVITALPMGTPINVCTAKPEVLDSLGPPGVGEYSVPNALSVRSSTCFPTKKDVDLRFNNDPDYKNLMQKRPDYLSETTSYFRANIWVSIGTTELSLYSVLYRTSSGKVHVALRSFGTP